MKMNEKLKYIRPIKTYIGQQATHPIKNKKECKALMIYWLKKSKIANTKHRRWLADRNYLLLLLGFNTAFRAEDLLQLKPDKLVKGYVSIKENKTKKTQNFRIKKELQNEVIEFCEKYELGSCDYLFTQKPGKFLPITRQQGNKILKETAQGIGLKQDFSMHSMRKTFAYHYYADTGKLLTLQKMLLHNDSATTLIYIEWDLDDVEIARESIYYFGVKKIER